MRILLAVDFDVEATLLAAIIEHGHDIVDRVTGAATLSERAAQLRPDAVVVQAAPETLTPESLSACDRAGARTIALVTDSVERQHAVSLGILERVDARDGWGAVERVLSRSVIEQPVVDGDRSQLLGAAEPRAAESHGDPRPHANSMPAATPDSTPLAAPAARHRGNANNRGSGRRVRKTSRGSRRSSLRGWAARSAASTDPAVAGVARPLRAGRVVAVWGPHGAPGRTTCAITLATEFARSGARTVLVDADSYGGAIGQLLAITDEAPGIAAACRLSAAGALTSDELNRLAQPVRARDLPLRVLTGITNPARWPELGRERMIGVLEQLRQWADVIVVDVGFNLEHDEELVSDISAPRRNAATHVVLERADRVIAIGEATPVGLQRLLRGRMALLDIVGAPERVRVVANRVRKGMHGVDTAAQVAEVLRRFGGVDDVVMLPDDPKACDRAITEATAVTQVSARSQLARSYVSLVANLLAELQRSSTPVT